LDNITHALAGLLVAQIAGRDRPWRGAACVSAMLASNMPDIDLVLTGLTGGRIGYLVHHRGHTHTLALLVPLALLSMAPAWIWFRKAALDWRPVLAIALLCGLLHLAMDGTNEYGVHPFWPLDDHWYYGDTIFIIEPLLWASAIPALFFSVKTRGARLVLGLLLVAMVMVTWILREFVRPPTAMTMTLYAALMIVVAKRTPVWIGAIAWAAVTLMFAVVSHQAEATARAAYAELHAADTIDDLVISPLPADPFCWRAIVVAHDRDRYRALTARISTGPSIVAASACPDTSRERTAPVEAIVTPDVDPRVAWGVALDLPRAEIVTLAQRCDVAAFLRFARVPFWMTAGEGVRVGDLRYDREPGLGFSEMDLPGVPGACPKRVPPWIPPRDTLIRGM